MEQNTIYRVTGTDYKAITETMLREANAASLFPDKDGLIGIKPNLVSPSEASYGATTHPEIVEGIICYLKEHGYNNIIMLEGSWVGDLTSDSVEVCGYDVLAERCGVPFVDMQKEPGVETDCSGMKLRIGKKALELDYLINVPVLKGHCQTHITCALKNLKGLLPNGEKRRFHALGLHEPIAHLNAKLKQTLVVVDHICGDLDFEDGGNPVIRNTILCGTDPVLMDSYVCRLLHYQPEDVPYIKMAEKLGVGSSNLENLNLVTIGTMEETELPRSRKVVEVSDLVEEVESCSACYGYLIPALDMLKADGLLDKLTEKICIGQGYRGKTGTLGVGNCTRKFCHTVEGCPPTETQMYDFLKQYIKNNT